MESIEIHFKKKKKKLNFKYLKNLLKLYKLILKNILKKYISF